MGSLRHVHSDLIFRSESARNPTFEPTFSLECEFGPAADVFVAYFADYDAINDRHGNLMGVAVGGLPRLSSSTSPLTAVQSITISVSDICSVLTIFLEAELALHHDLSVMGKVFAVALAVGFDVLAISVGIGAMRLALDVSVRFGAPLQPPRL